MRKLIVLSIALTCLASGTPAWAQRVDMLGTASPSSTLSEGIAVVVNDAVISTGDVQARVALALLSSGLPDKPEIRAKLMPQVLRSLVDEQLQLQEGKKLGIAIPAEEIRDAFGKIAQDNKIPGGDMVAFLKAHNVPPSTLQAQIKAALTWNKVVMREVRPHIDVGEDEINAQVDKMRANAGKQEYLVSEIFLAVDKPQDDAQVKALADKLVAQLREGTPFAPVARQFSQGAGAGTGGDIGWVQAGQLVPEADQLLQGLDVNQIGGPVRSTGGYHILGLRNKRIVSLGSGEIKARLAQAFHPFVLGRSKESLLRDASKIRNAITSCQGAEARLKGEFQSWSWHDLGEVLLSKAPQWLSEKVSRLNVGESSEPMSTDKGALILFLCDRSFPEGDVNRDAIRNAIGGERMELMARRLMRDLRRDAFIDVRMKASS